MELSWVITAVLCIAIIYFMRWLSNLNKYYWEKQGVPYFDSPPVIGILSDIIFSKKGMGEIFNDIYQRFKGEKIVGYNQFLNNVIMIRDPELVNQVLIKDFSYFEDRGPEMQGQKDLFSLSFSNLTGDKWRIVRHKLTPTFTSGKMKIMFAAIKECSEEVAVYLNERTDQDLDIKQILTKYVLNVIGSIAFGLKIDTLNDKEEKSTNFLNYSTKFFKPSYLVILKMFFSMSFPKLRNIFNLKIIDEEVETFFTKLTEDVMRYREGTNTKRNDFLQLMLDLKKKEEDISHKSLNIEGNSLNEDEPVDSEDKEIMDQLKNTAAETGPSVDSEIFSEKFIAAQTFIFISGGSETTAASLAFILYELAQNQDLQKKVQEEISDVLSGHEFNYESVKKLTYMEQFINETFRLHPIAAILMRVCKKDYKIPGTEVLIKRGDFVNIPVLGLQKDHQYFPDHEKFDPDRFQDMDAIPKGVYLPFGIGPRMCIAMRLAMLEMKVLLAVLLQSYSVTLSKKTKVPLKLMKNSFMVAVEGGIWVKFNKRQV